MSAARTVTWNTGALFAGSAIKMVSSLAFVIVATWKLGPSGFGEYELSLHYLELFVSLIATAVGILLAREVARDHNRISAILTTSAVLVLCLSVVGCLLLACVPMLLGYGPRATTALWIVTLAVLPGAVAYLLETTFVALEAAHYVTFGTLVEGLTRVTLGLALLFSGFGVFALVTVLIVSRLCLLTFYATCLRRHVKTLRWEFSTEVFARFVRDWRAFAAENWLSNLSNSVGVIILSAFHSEAAAGLYFAALKVTRLGTVVASSYTNAVFPHMSRLYKESAADLQRLGNVSLRFMLAMVLPVIVTISVFADRVVALLFTPDFAATTPILRITIWVLLLNFINPFLSHILFARGEQKHSMAVAAARFVVHLPLAFLLIPTYAGVGEAWSSLIASCCASLVYFYFVLRGGQVESTLRMMAWTSLPALLLAGFLLLLDGVQVALLISMGATLYLLLLLMLRILSFNDLQSLWKLRSS